MSDFDLIEYGFNAADETINFGTRRLADGENLHEAVTLAALRCSQPSEENVQPHINAVSQDGSVYVSINRTMRVFKDKQCSDEDFSRTFEAIIDCFCVSANGDYLLICFRNGTVHLIACKEAYSCIRSKECKRDDNGDRFFINSFSYDGCFLIVTKMGQVYRVSVKDDHELDCLFEFNFRTEIASFQYPFLLVTGTKLAVLDVENNGVISDAGLELKKIIPLSLMFLALDFEGNLFRICPITLLVFPMFDAIPFQDMELVCEGTQIQIAAVLKGETGQNQIQLLDYPGLEKLYSIKVSDDIHLIPLDTVHHELLYLSKISSDGTVSEIRFQLITETDPEQRLHRLLLRRNYEEAERIATLFGLDRGVINKAKAEEIVRKTTCNSVDIDDLLRLLDSIEDNEFRLKCLNVDCENYENIRKITMYGCRLQLKKQDRKTAAEELQKSVILLQYRFNVFLTIMRDSVEDMQSWLHFAECDLIEEVKMMLRDNKIDEATIIYSHLDGLAPNRLTEAHVSDILSFLNTMSITTYQSFLPVFISATISILPSTLPLFVKWTQQNVFYLEQCGRDDFPNNAIRFTEKIVELMKVGDGGDVHFQRQCLLHRDSLVELSQLLSTLKTLKTLKEEYRISIPVKGYLSGPRDVVRLLLETYPGDYDVFRKRFLCKYMMENQMEPNEVLLEEIRDLMRYEQQYWVNVIEPILNCITSASDRLQAVKYILNVATVPWSPVVKKIALEALDYSESSEIRELIENEPVQVVLRKPIYKIKERRNVPISDLKFVIKRIICCNESTMVEDVYQLCNNAERRHIANMLLITHFIKLGRYQTALDLLDDNSREEVLICAKELAGMIETVLNTSEAKLPPSLKNNYLTIADAIFRRLNDPLSNFKRQRNQETLDLIRNVHSLDRHFNRKSIKDDLRRPETKNKIVDEVLEELRNESETGKKKTDQVFDVIYKLAGSVGFDKDEILLKFCQRSGDYNTIVKASQRLYESEASPKNLCLMVVLLMKHVGTYKLQMLDSSGDSESSLIVTESEEVVDDKVFFKGLQLAEKLIEVALCKAENEELMQCLQVAKWVGTCFYFIKNENADLMKRIFPDIDDSSCALPGFLTFSTIQKIFVAFCAYSTNLGNPHLQYLTQTGDAFTEDQFLKEVKLLLPVLSTIGEEGGQHFTSYKIVQILRNCLMEVPKPNSAILEFFNVFLKKKCAPKLISSLLNNTVVDCDLMYNLLLSCNREDSHKFIINSLKMYKRQPNKFGAISSTGLHFLKFHKLQTGKAQMLNALLVIKWWKKVEKRKFEYDVFFKMKAEDRFEFLVKADCLDMKLAKEYCDDFNLEQKKVFKYFLKRVFVNWKPDYEVTTDGIRKKLLVKNSEGDLLKKCQDVMEAMDVQQILDVISSVSSCINPYYYEVFITIINILKVVDPSQDNSKKLTMLIFLMDYHRVSKPSETEIEQWYTIFPESQSPDPLSEFRLAFTSFLFTKQVFDIIRPEINLKTYEVWFGAIETLEPHLTKNEICSYVVKDVVASGVLTKDATDEWVLYERHGDLFQKIDECVANITNLEFATSGTYHLMTHTPRGADQVTAAKLCYKYAVQYRNCNPESKEVEKAVIKVEKKYQYCSAMHILHTYQLAQPKYVNLLTSPKQLILALYTDERILKEIDLGFNKAAEALACLFNIDIKKFRSNLILNCLGAQDPSYIDLDSSIVYSNSNGRGSNDDESLRRTAYVCRSDDVDYWRRQLVLIGLGGENERTTNVQCKARALKVFAMISDAETIQELTAIEYEGFMNFIDKLTIVSNLQFLGITVDVVGLDQHNKRELLNRLVQRAGTVLAIKTMALICMTYKIYEEKFWEFIVNSSISFSLFAELKTYIGFLKNPKFQHKAFYINAWQKLIDMSFVNSSSAEGLERTLLANFLTLQSCPVLFYLNLDDAFLQCMNRGKPEFAAVLLQYVDSNRRDEYVKQIRNSNKDLVATLNDLHQNGLSGISYVKSLLVGS